jgi:hypothetical protein
MNRLADDSIEGIGVYKTALYATSIIFRTVTAKPKVNAEG